MNVTAPKSEKPTMKPIALVSENTRLRKIGSGRIGSAACVSASRNPASSKTPSASSTIIWGAPQP